MKIGLMGGGFDPLHVGHLGAAQDAADQLGLDRVIILPAAETPRKPGAALTAGDRRLAMLKLATADHPLLEVSDFELTQGGVSFTINTVRHFRDHYPQDELFWIIGADQVESLDHWRSIDELALLTEFIYLARPGHHIKAPPATPGLTLHRCQGRCLDISSTKLRENLRQNEPVNEFIPPEVIVYIGQWKLYQ